MGAYERRIWYRHGRLLTRVFILIGAGEPDKLGRGATARTDDVDEGAVYIKLEVTRAGRGHEVLEAHQVFAWGCGSRDSEVELLFKLKGV